MSSSDLQPSRAIIDIGSNTVRLVIYGGPPRAPVVLFNEKVSAKLGKGLGESGKLSRKSQEAALKALARYRALLRLNSVTRIDTVATAAVRDASNGAEFLESVRALGLEPRLLSGEEEALTSASGVLGAFPDAHGVVADLGGGSLELVEVGGGVCSHGVSLPLGTLLLPGLMTAGTRAFHQKVAKIFDAAEWQPQPGTTLYLVGGSLRAFAKYAMRRSNWPYEDPHGFEIGAPEAERIAVSLAERRSVVALPVPGISSSRLAVLPDAAQLLRAVLRKIKPDRIVFSSWGLREGLIYRSLGPAAQAQDPLIAGVAAFAGRYRVATSSAVMIAGWCASASAAKSPSRRQNLLLAATMLALASARLEPNLRADHATDWAMRKRWIGLGREDRVLLAACLLANCGRLTIPDDWLRCARPDRIHEAQGWGLAIRLCRRFSDSAVDALTGSSLVANDGKITLGIGAACADLMCDDVERDLRALAAHLGLEAGWAILPASAGGR